MYVSDCYGIAIEAYYNIVQDLPLTIASDDDRWKVGVT